MTGLSHIVAITNNLQTQEVVSEPSCFAAPPLVGHRENLIGCGGVTFVAIDPEG